MRNKGLALLGLGLAIVLGTRKMLHRRSEANYLFLRKVVFITGGSRGLGLVLARQLAIQNARIAICARNPEELEKAKVHLQDEYAAEVLVIQCDVTDQNQVQQAINQTVTHFGRLDVLINNAGDVTVSPVENNSVDDFRKMMDLYFYGPLYTMSAAIPYMQKQGGGKIVNISSIGGRISVPHLLPYSAGKFALSGLSEGMTAELAMENISVTTVYPGLMRTGSPRNVEVKGNYEKEYRWFKVSDSLPGLSVSAENAAAQILRACRRGDATLTISLPAKFAAAFHGIAPGSVIKANKIVNFLLPKAVAGTGSHRGHETEYEKKESWLTSLTDKAAKENFNNLNQNDHSSRKY